MIIKMPFGKFRGQPVEELPDDYLAWLSRLDDIRSPLREAIAAEIERRVLEAKAEPEPDPAAGIPPGLVQKWFRQLTLKFHPDRGGSHEGMIAVTEAKDLLLAMLAENEAPRKAA